MKHRDIIIIQKIISEIQIGQDIVVKVISGFKEFE